MQVKYEHQTVKAKFFFARFAHRKRLKISVNLVKKYFPSQSISLIDYGCGDGFFLNELSKIFPHSNLIGYDPYSNITHNTFNLINDFNKIKENSIDIISCFETLEHLDDIERKILYGLIEKVKKKNGKIIFSVPIIGGLTLILKEINRAIMFRRKSDYSMKELFLSTFFNVSAKRAENIKTSHKGFNFQQLEIELRTKFQFKSKTLSPFKFLPWFLNSTVFFVLE